MTVAVLSAHTHTLFLLCLSVGVIAAAERFTAAAAGAAEEETPRENKKLNNIVSAASCISVSCTSSRSELQDNDEAALLFGLVTHSYSPIDATFNRTERLSVLRSTPYGKAPGPDEVYSEALRHILSNGLRFLLRCINHSWTTGTIPAEWRRATIVPLLKPGKLPELLESYRPIILTFIVNKVAEKMVLKRLLCVWTPYSPTSMHIALCVPRRCSWLT
ncbi:hypothetical protein MOQ_006848 [Trypanosoma cruzi marinkellei]|uniref:Trans-sialidase n=1 Tax=Trypanosoma cruzi marinkellei TaxID=85056 RepID=K2MQJ5_TRYCR|nr:hypothetical protein MOQ_006848 [Trypanosoma cruzi marinkellei]